MEQFYADAPAEQVEALRQFRAAHPPKHLTVNGVEWEYLTGGLGDEVILLLVGGLRVADAGFRAIQELERDYTVIAPSYPPLPAMSALSSGFAAILDAEGVERAHVIGGSFGGMIAQCFAREHPDRVGKLVLSNTAVPDDKTAQRYQDEYELIAPVDEAVVRLGAKERFLYMIGPNAEEETFWRAYLDELFTARIGKDHLLASVQCIRDFAMSYRLKPNDLLNQYETVLLIESDNDDTFSGEQREAVKRMYPQAQVYTFSGAGHSPGTTRRAEYFATVRAFLNGEEV